MLPAVSAQGELDVVQLAVQVGEEEVAELVEGHAPIAAGEAQVIAIGNHAGRSGRASVHAHALKERTDLEAAVVGEDHHVGWVGRIDGDRGLGLVVRQPADVNVGAD